MKRTIIISVLSVLVMCLMSNQSFAAGAWTGNLNIFYGYKALDSDDMTATGDDLVVYSTGETYSGTYYSSHYDFSDSAIGYWLSGGAYWTFAKQFNVGIDVSYSKAKMDFGEGKEAEAGGLHYGLFAGFHW